ncbi:hypothetical protein [Pedobacter insulae]|nr:hypothetical protein [Pedobacter insulae]
MTKKRSGIPELGLNYAAFADLVEGTGFFANFYEDLSAIYEAKNLNY